MFNNKKIVAVIPAKGLSVRVKNKNLQKIGNLTLLERKIKQLMESKLIDEVCVGSDSDEILEISRKMGAQTLLRDAYHCDEGRASANEMIGDIVKRVESDVILWAHCTNPFVDAKIYNDALLTFFENSPNFDSLVSVTKIQSHFWYQGRPLNFDPKSKRHQLASTLEGLFHQNGAIFIQDNLSFNLNSYFYGNSPFLFEISEPFSFDVNSYDDLELARLLDSHI
jgi:CMP-N-acetylneuraminic acid synthetase